MAGDVAMRQLLTFAVKFAVSMLIMIIGCCVVWEWGVHLNVYDCTDPGLIDFLTPGDWIHGHFITVSEVAHGRSMSEPDTIKTGWSIHSLWNVWYAYIAISILSSLAFSLIRWMPFLPKHIQPGRQTDANPAPAGSGA